MRILSYIAAFLSAGVGITCLVVISHYQMVFETVGMELPNMTRLIYSYDGWLPALLLFALAILLVLFAQLGRRKAAMITSYCTFIVIMAVVIILPLGLMLPFMRITSEMSEETVVVQEPAVQYERLIETTEEAQAVIEQLEQIQLENLSLAEIDAHEAIGIANLQAGRAINFVVRIKNPKPVTFSANNLAFTTAIDEICKQADAEWKIDFNETTQSPVLIVTLKPVPPKPIEITAEMMYPETPDYGEGWWGTSRYDHKRVIEPDLSKWIDGYERVELVLYNYKVDPDRPLVVDGVMHPGIADEYTVTLTADEVHSLVAAVTGDHGGRGMASLCGYQPHHGFIFYDKHNKVVSHLEICFTCHEYLSYPREGLSDTWDIYGLFQLVQSKGLPFRDSIPEWEAYFAARNKRLAK